MDIKQQCIAGYLTEGIGYRQLAAKYDVSRTTICKWVMHQGIYNLQLSEKVTEILPPAVVGVL